MIAAAPPAWALWLACSLWLLALVLAAAAVVLVRRLLRQWAPTLGPLLSMFGAGHGARGEPATPTEGHETPGADIDVTGADDFGT